LPAVRGRARSRREPRPRDRARLTRRPSGLRADLRRLHELSGPVTPTSTRDAITPSIVGASVGPVAHEVDARWLMAYAAALDERDRLSFDTLSGEGRRAPPLFAVCYEWPVAQALRERIAPARLQGRSVHATHHLVIHRAPRAGDRLVTTGRIAAVEARRSG